MMGLEVKHKPLMVFMKVSFSIRLYCRNLGEAGRVRQVTSFPENLNPSSICLHPCGFPHLENSHLPFLIKILPIFQGSAPFPPLSEEQLALVSVYCQPGRVLGPSLPHHI